jgi:hypothetical protein
LQTSVQLFNWNSKPAHCPVKNPSREDEKFFVTWSTALKDSIGIEEDPEDHGQILSLNEGRAFKEEINFWMESNIDGSKFWFVNWPNNNRLGCRPEMGN